MSIRFSISLTFILAFISGGQAQVFEDVSNLFNPFDEITAGGCFAGCGVSFYDFNNDGLDDLTFAGLNTDIRMFANTGGTFEEVEGVENESEAKQILWADIDNDGDADLFVSKYQAQPRLYLNDGNGGLADITEQSGIPLDDGQENYGAAFGDYDRDGFLDLYICNYNSVEDETVLANFLLRNNGNGTFADVTDEAGVSNGIKLSLGAVWLDYNKDLWPDLFVFNDKTNFENALYLNQGDGTFSDVSAFTGTDQAINAMSGTTGDYNNDGWLDIYVSNGPIIGNLLLKNNNGFSFIDDAPVAGVQTFDMCWSAQWIDYDNNMWQDLYVAVRDWDAMPTANHFYVNNEDGSFTHDLGQVHFPGDDKIGWSNAVGDIDGDGYQDLVQFTDQASTLGLWMNEGGDNHYLKFDLTGTVSNADGIGARIECHAGEITQTRYTYCGEDYLAQDSQHEIIGLSSFASVDSLLIHWPSGIIDHYYDLAANQHVEFVEGATLSAQLNLSDQFYLCEGDSVEVTVGAFEEYAWSNGSTEPTVTISENELISVEVIDQYGLSYTSNSVEIELIILPQVEATVSDISCYGMADGIASLTANEGEFVVQWEDGETDPIQELDSGYHAFTISDVLGYCSFVDSVFIAEPLALSVEQVSTDVLCFGDSTGTIQLSPSGGTGTLGIEWMGLTPDALSAGFYSVLVVDSNDCELIVEWEIEQPDPLIADIQSLWVDDQYILDPNEDGGTPPYDFLWSDGSSDEMIIEPDEDTYWVEVTDANGCGFVSEPFVFTDLNDYNINEIEVFFNSFDQSFFITNLPQTLVNIHLWDAQGRLVRQHSAFGSSASLGSAGLTRGLYILHFSGSGESVVKRVLVH